MYNVNESLEETKDIIQKQNALKDLISNSDISDDYLKGKLMKQIEVNVCWLEDIKQDEENALMDKQIAEHEDLQHEIKNGLV